MVEAMYEKDVTSGIVFILKNHVRGNILNRTLVLFLVYNQKKTNTVTCSRNISPVIELQTSKTEKRVHAASCLKSTFLFLTKTEKHVELNSETFKRLNRAVTHIVHLENENPFTKVQNDYANESMWSKGRSGEKKNEKIRGN